MVSGQQQSRPHFTPGKDPVPILQEAGWAPGPVWGGGKSPPRRDSIPDLPVRSSVVIPLELPGPQKTHECVLITTVLNFPSQRMRFYHGSYTRVRILNWTHKGTMGVRVYVGLYFYLISAEFFREDYWR